jgi:hypothetical protein
MENKIVNLQINDNLAQTEKAVGSLKSQLRQAQNEVTLLADKFGATSKEAVEAAKKAGELKDKIGDAKALTDAFNPDAKFKALSASLSGVAGGFAAVQGGMGLIGVESADLEKQLLKVQSAMALSQGLQSVGESIDSFKQLGAVLKNTSVVQKVLTATTAAYTFVTQASTTGLKLFRLALIGTGIGAIVVGLGLLIANFDKVKNAVMNVIPGLKSVGDFFGSIVNSITDFVGATSDASRALDKLKKDADNTLSVNKKFMQEHGDQVDEYTKKKIEAKNAYAEAIKEDGVDQVALAKKLNRELAAIEFSRGDEKRKIQKDANEKAIADKKADNEKAKKQTEDDAKKLKEEKDKAVITEAEVFRNKLEAVQKVEADAKKANADALLTEQQLAIQTENEAYQTKLDNARAFGLSTKEIEIQHLNNINNINLTAQEKKYADKKAADDKEIELEKNKSEAIANFKQNLSNVIAGIEATGLAKTKAGQAALKALTLVQIGIDTALAFSTAVPMAIKAGKEAAAVAGPAAPVVGPLATVASYLSSASMIAKNIARAKQLLSSGGSSGGSAPSGGSGGGMGSAPTAPAFNVVGASSTNQLAQTISNKEAQPIKAYVVANDVTTQQGLDRNIVQSASIG